MRDARKLCGLTVHQKLARSSVSLALDAQDNQTLTNSNSQPKSRSDKTGLGVQCPEYAFKDTDEKGRSNGSISNASKRKQAHQAPADYRGKAYLGVPSPADPFSVFVWYAARQPESDPEFVCVDITVDGKRSPGWVIRSGRKHGVSIGQIMHRGKPTLFEFSPAKTNSSVKPTAHRPVLAGTIEAKFWRVMKLDGSAVPPAKRQKKDIDPENTADVTDSDEDDPTEYIPDEGVPALCVLTLHYRDMTWLTSNSNSGNTSVFRGSRTAFNDVTNQRTNLSRGDTLAKNNLESTSSKGLGSVTATTLKSDWTLIHEPSKKASNALIMSELSTTLSSPIVSKHHQMNFSCLQSSPMHPNNPCTPTHNSLMGPSSHPVFSTLFPECNPMAIDSLCSVTSSRNTHSFEAIDQQQDGWKSPLVSKSDMTMCNSPIVAIEPDKSKPESLHLLESHQQPCSGEEQSHDVSSTRKHSLSTLLFAVDTILSPLVMSDSNQILSTTQCLAPSVPQAQASLKHITPNRSRIPISIHQSSKEHQSSVSDNPTTSAKLITMGRIALSITDTKTSLLNTLSRSVRKLLNTDGDVCVMDTKSCINGSSQNDECLDVGGVGKAGVWVESSLSECVSFSKISDACVSTIKSIHVVF
ncbi:hypothetical protein QVD99_004634 [Batrachochytrium dendrobatidis]|nr:hypothetical protein QVD99_004634 [Batrachochytrium dendrobatidis]